MEAVTGWITSTVQDLRTMNVRQLVLQTLNLGASDTHQSCCLRLIRTRVVVWKHELPSSGP